VRADRAQVEQVLVNLGLNARDAMGGNGRLTIQTTTVEVTGQVSTTPDTPSVTGGTYARLIVRDTGAGMDTATIAHIFEPFFTTKSIGEGTGLGLASVFGVVKQSGGLIQVESTPGEGTTFTIDLPQVVVDLPVVQVAEPAVMTRGTETILVVDDEDVVRTWVSRCLRGLGYRVVEASEAGEALRLIAEEERPIELVVSDMVMPGMDGGQLRNRLVELRPGLPVLIMSGFAREELVRQGRLDAQAFLLPKPFGPEALASKVRELLDGRKQAKLPR
jgi:two-component system cell cycle sensor histidine kinase/response regulator CckA